MTDPLDLAPTQLFSGYGNPVLASKQSERDRDTLRKRESRERARDVEVHEPVDMNRRERCEADPPLWLRTYLSNIFYKPFSRDDEQSIEEAVRILRDGGQKANAEPRGGGKTSRSTGLQLWGTMSGEVCCCPLIFKNQKESNSKLKGQKKILQSNELLYEDYPEICCFARAIGGTPARAQGMTYNGENVFFSWLPDEIILPWVPQIPWAKCSGSALLARGMDGHIRGMTIVTPGGEILRPDWILIDDPQDKKTAGSAILVKKTLEIIESDILGLRGHGEKLGVFANVTIISQNDVAYQLTDQKLYPQWNGRRKGMLLKLPDNMELWQEYEEIVYRAMHDPDDPTEDAHTCTQATEFYKANRAAMDAGAEIPNEYLHISRELMYAAKAAHENKDPLLAEYNGEWISLPFLHALAERDGIKTLESSIQYAMNLRIMMGAAAFEAECNNNPSSIGATPILAITPYLVTSRLNGMPAGIAPDGYDRVMVGIDVGKEKLNMVSTAFAADGRRGHILDYCEYPIMAPEGDARVKGSAEYIALDLAVYNALVQVRQRLEASPYKSESGIPLAIDTVCVDVRFMQDAVNRACDERRNWHSMMGFARKDLPRPGKDCIVTQFIFAKRTGIGGRWRHWQDADAHKRFVHEGFGVEPGQPGSLTMFGSKMVHHKEFAAQICAEVYMEEADGVMRWQLRDDNLPNHYLDATALCYAGATRRGLSVFDKQLPDIHTAEQEYSEDTQQSEHQQATPAPAPKKKRQPRAATIIEL